MGFRIEQDPQTVLSFVNAVQAAADAEREALGFLPPVAYEQASRKGEITILLNEDGERSYAGHVWVSGAFPHARVVQLCVLPAYRGNHLASRLLRSAVQRAEAQGYLFIKARVASDLITANRVYENHGFEHVSTKPGGRSRGRDILIRSKELSSPSLFNYRAAKSATLDGAEASLDEQALYILDVNVFFDVLRQRKTSAAAAKIINAALAGEVRVAVTAEFVKELQRTSKGIDDPVLAFARLLPALGPPPTAQIASIVDELGPIVFPDQCRDGVLSAQDESDLHHLAEAILSGVDGLITAEKAIIRADSKLRADYGLSVWGTDAFAALIPTFSQPMAAVRAEHDLLFRAEVHDADLEHFLVQRGVPAEALASFRRKDAADKRFSAVGVREDGHLIAAALYQAPAGPKGFARVLVAGDDHHPSIATAADYLLEHHVRLAAGKRPARVELVDVPGQSTVRRAAIANGFLAQAGSSGLQKIALGTAVIPTSWAECRRALLMCANAEVPAQMPSFGHNEQSIELTADGRTNSLSLVDLESVLSPALFLLPGRSAAIVPIQRVWADDLLGGIQLPLFPKPEAALRSRRVYFSSPRNAATLVRGRPIIFYESGKGLGRSAAIAVARVSRAEVIQKDRAPEELLQAAVVRGRALNRLTKDTTVLAVWFDNIMPFATPVSFAQLKVLGVDDKTNLVRSREIDAETASKIIGAGRPHAT